MRSSPLARTLQVKERGEEGNERREDERKIREEEDEVLKITVESIKRRRGGVKRATMWSSA